jgi:hypothetical protein
MVRQQVHHCTFVAVSLFTFFLGSTPSHSQDRKEVRPAELDRETEWVRNGIAVGRPKVFDNRSLTIMLQQLSESLRTMQVIDAKTVSTALGNFQGSKVTDNSFVVSASGPSTAGMTDADTVGTAPGQITTKTTDATGASTSVTKNDPTATSVTTSDVLTATRAAQTPTAPTLAPPTTDLGVSVPFGQNAGDLLSDQVNLTYQIFNLRMISERSLSDRLWKGKPRRQAVLGFDISLDPPSYAKDSAAVIEISVCDPKSNAGDVSLVAMMPQEKTYNAAALSSSSKAFAGSAMAGPVSVGAAGRRSQKTMYLYRDNDTIAYEDMMRAETASQLEFGWVFRPVLGRRSVSPGMRQMFAVISLPDDDCSAEDPATSGSSSKASPIKKEGCSGARSLTVKVRTYWKKYDRGTLTTASASQIMGFSGIQNIFGVSPKLTPKYLDFATYSNVEVTSPSVTDDNLKATIKDVTWSSTGGNSVVVSLTGKNFFTGTTVIMGGQTYRESSGNLLIKSDGIMDILTDTTALANSDGVVIGRYGRSARISAEGTNRSDTPAGLDLIDEVALGPNLGGDHKLTVTLSIPCTALPRNEVSNKPKVPFILINDTNSPGRAYFDCSDKNPAVLTTWVSDDLVAGKAPRLQLIYPFGLTSQIKPLPDASLVFQLERLSQQENKVSESFLLKALTDPNFESLDKAGGCWTLEVGPDYEINLPTSKCTNHPDSKNMQKLTATTILIREIPEKKGSPLFEDKFILKDNVKGFFEVAVPAAKAEAKKPAFAAKQTLTINQNDSRWVTVLGTGLEGVTSVKINSVPIDLRLTAAKKPEDKDQLQLNIQRTISEKPGDVDITFYDSSNKVIDTIPLKIVCTSCKSTSSK